MTADIDSLERFDRLPSLQVARAILREAFGLELLVVGERGPLAHVRGGVTLSSSDVCRASLFSREGFSRCDAVYRAVGEMVERAALPCHLGLAVVTEPAALGAEVLAHVVASGFLATGLGSCPAPDPAQLAARLRDLDPALSDPSEAVRHVPAVRGDRIEIVRAVLRTAAAEIAAHEEDHRRRIAGAEGELPGLWGIIGESPPMRAIFERLRNVARSDATVLVLGESGTGKELVARALHDHGPRAGRPFVAQSCAAMSDELLESTLFGHVRGAFSGALRSSSGLFGAAEGGTLFLDNVSEMSPAMQVKLLRVLQDRSYLPVGATAPRRADVRVVAASRRDLEELVHAGGFRQDLFYRLHVLPVSLPPLRDRGTDLRLLVDHLVRAAPRAPRRVSDAAWACLERHNWPGNVQELAAEVKRWELIAADAREVGPEHLSSSIREAGGYGAAVEGTAAAAAASGEGTLLAAVEALEKALIRRCLERTGGNRTQVARELGISRTTLGQRLRRYGLS